MASNRTNVGLILSRMLVSSYRAVSCTVVDWTLDPKSS
jgi:hypothetical protein